MSKILIIEDEVAIADLEKDYLELSDFKVDICNTGDEGLKTALAGDYDLIILDIGVLLLLVIYFILCRRRSARRKIFPFSWYLRRRTTLIRSAA